MLNNVLKCICCVATIYLGINEVSGMRKEVSKDDGGSHVLQDVLPKNSDAELSKASSYFSDVYFTLQRDIDEPSFIETLEKLAYCSRLAIKDTWVNLKAFHGIFEYLAEKRWIIKNILHEDQISEEVLSDFRDIIQIMPEVIKEPWIPNPQRILLYSPELFTGISKIRDEAMKNVRTFANVDSLKIFGQYGLFITFAIRQSMRDAGVILCDSTI